MVLPPIPIAKREFNPKEDYSEQSTNWGDVHSTSIVQAYSIVQRSRILHTIETEALFPRPQAESTFRLDPYPYRGSASVVTLRRSR